VFSLANLTPSLLKWWFRATGRLHLLELYNGILGSGKPGAAMLPAELIDQALELMLSGIGNTLCIHSNRQWIWPYWVEQQQNPGIVDFIPTGVNVVTTNLSHRNWTTIGCLQSKNEAMVDPVGMITTRPFSWSLLPYLVVNKICYAPPKMMPHITQQLSEHEPCGIRTNYNIKEYLEWEFCVWPNVQNEQEWLEWTVKCKNASTQNIQFTMGMSIRPYNMLTMGPIHNLSYQNQSWTINGQNDLFIDYAPSEIRISDRQKGDPMSTPDPFSPHLLTSRSGLLSGVMECQETLPPQADKVWSGRLLIGSRKNPPKNHHHPSLPENSLPQLHIEWPKKILTEAFISAKRRLHVFDDIDYYTPGSFFYHHHWIRDSAFLMMADLNLGRFDHLEKKVHHWIKQQHRNGMFNSQNGEWDSSGQVLFLVHKITQRTQSQQIAIQYFKAFRKAAMWIIKVRKSTKDDLDIHYGLLPSGISAEHFGPNDHYYWDNFWSLAGLKAWLDMSKSLLSKKEQIWWNNEIESYQKDIQDSMEKVIARFDEGLLPCAPTRRFDSAAIGNLIAIHPLKLFDEKSPWVINNCLQLYKNQVKKGLFYQDIIHTGFNPYLTLQLSTVFMLQHNTRYLKLLESVLHAGGPTMSWPEAIHPNTRGGCMGDGDHGWVLAEVINLLRNIVVIEEQDEIHLGRGIHAKWFKENPKLIVKNAPIDGGNLSYQLQKTGDGWLWEWSIQASSDPLKIVLWEPLFKKQGARFQQTQVSPKGSIQWKA
jgi:hypothetical protein